MRAERAVGDLVCPEHGKSATNIRRKRLSDTEWTVGFTPCCDAAGEIGRKAIRKALAD